MDRRIVISLGGLEYNVTKARLGKYLKMQTVLRDLGKASKVQDSGAMADALFRYIALSMKDYDRGLFNITPWMDIVRVYQELIELNTIGDEYNLISVPARDSVPPPWDHPKRGEITWIHLLAKSYNWHKEDIENLWPEEAIALIQEILADEQLDREFLHALSEVAYIYNKSTKKSVYQPLRRPSWMVVRRDPIHVITQLHKDMLPVGNVVRAKHEDETIH